MHVILLVLGLIMALVGLALVGFGLATGGAGAGNALTAGMTALVGGPILIGLASVILQLRRIAQALEARPPPHLRAAEAATPEPWVPSVAGKGRCEAAPQTALAAEPRLPAPHAGGRDELSGREPRVEATAQTGAPPPPAHLLPQRPEASRTADPGQDSKFDAEWPAQLEPEGLTDSEAEQGSAIAAQSLEAEPAPAPAPEVTIFKSGVIDGMAYTLYSDGSIEAELTDDTVRFSSATDLRAYLAAREQGGG
jgi:hypothetical protein